MAERDRRFMDYLDVGVFLALFFLLFYSTYVVTQGDVPGGLAGLLLGGIGVVVVAVVEYKESMRKEGDG